MYEAKHFAQEEVSVLRNYVVKNPFATLIVEASDGPSVDHLPFESDESNDSQWSLLGYIAPSNLILQTFESGRALAFFCAHQGYVSPKLMDDEMQSRGE